MKFPKVKKTTKQLILFSFGILVLLSAKELLLGGEAQNQTQLQILGQNEMVDAPNFTLPDIEGKIRNLRDFQGRFVLLNFWTTW